MSAEQLVILALAGLLTFSLRFALFGLLGKVELPPVLRRGLPYVPPAVFAAYILPEMVQPGGVFDVSLGNERLLAGVGAGLVALVMRKRPGGMLATIAAGMMLLWVLGAVG